MHVGGTGVAAAPRRPGVDDLDKRRREVEMAACAGVGAETR